MAFLVISRILLLRMYCQLLAHEKILDWSLRLTLSLSHTRPLSTALAATALPRSFYPQYQVLEIVLRDTSAFANRVSPVDPGPEWRR